jgi:hypothetical protein
VHPKFTERSQLSIKNDAGGCSGYPALTRASECFLPQTSLMGLPGNIQLAADQRLPVPDRLERKQRLHDLSP